MHTTLHTMSVHTTLYHECAHNTLPWVCTQHSSMSCPHHTFIYFKPFFLHNILPTFPCLFIHTLLNAINAHQIAITKRAMCSKKSYNTVGIQTEHTCKQNYTKCICASYTPPNKESITKTVDISDDPTTIRVWNGFVSSSF